MSSVVSLVLGLGPVFVCWLGFCRCLAVVFMFPVLVGDFSLMFFVACFAQNKVDSSSGTSHIFTVPTSRCDTAMVDQHSKSHLLHFVSRSIHVDEIDAATFCHP